MAGNHQNDKSVPVNAINKLINTPMGQSSSSLIQRSPLELAVNLAMFNKVAQRRWRYVTAFDWGTDGFVLGVVNRGNNAVGSIICSHAMYDGNDWIHTSISYKYNVPTYHDLLWLQKAVFGQKRWAFQVFPPEKDKVNYHPNALHLWGRADGVNALPYFSVLGQV